MITFIVPHLETVVVLLRSVLKKKIWEPGGGGNSKKNLKFL